MTPHDVVLLGSAGLVAGSLNAVAGGGSLISFPALLAVGYASVPANVTNTVALWPGYTGGVLGYRKEIRDQRVRLTALAVTSAIGAVLGAILLLTVPAGVFRALVPFLILASSLLLALQPAVARVVRALPGPDREHRGAPLHAVVGLSSVYGAFFGAGLGVMLLGALGVFLSDDLQRVNGLKNALSLLINTVALLAFALFGPVVWNAVAVMAVASLVGGYAGARIARRLDETVLRIAVVTFGVAVGIRLLLG